MMLGIFISESVTGTIMVNGDPVAVDDGKVTVQLLRDNDGVETIRIRMKDNKHRISPNQYMALVTHTQYVSTDAVISKQFYNHAQLEPLAEFDGTMVSQGNVLYYEEEGERIPYAIESGASVTMTAGYTSAARKQVTQIGNTSNTAWSDNPENYIQLPEKYSKFYYDLYVDLPKDDPTSKIVMIDALPEENDHSPFVERDLRGSQFKVHITGEDPGIKVWSSPNLGAGTQVEVSQYKFEVTTRHEFEAADWDGNGTGWEEIDLSDGIDETEEELLNNARSFRIIIDDPELLSHPNEAIMGKNHQVHVRFNAELENPLEADPGTFAWNSFGYRYTVPIGATGMSTSLNAEPLKIGVMVPSVPYVIKDQRTPHNHYKPIDKSTDYQFLIYTGSAIADLNDTSSMTIEDILSVLEAGGRDCTMVSLNIGAGEANGQTDYLDDEKKWGMVSGTFGPTEDRWVWNDGAKYTIIELPWAENGFVFNDTQHSPVNNYTFVQNSSGNLSPPHE